MRNQINKKDWQALSIESLTPTNNWTVEQDGLIMFEGLTEEQAKSKVRFYRKQTNEISYQAKQKS